MCVTFLQTKFSAISFLIFYCILLTNEILVPYLHKVGSWHTMCLLSVHQQKGNEMSKSWKTIKALRSMACAVRSDLQPQMREYLQKYSNAHARAFEYGVTLRKEGHQAYPTDKADAFIDNKIIEGLMGLDCYIKPDALDYTRELIALIVEDDRNDYRETIRLGFRSNHPDTDLRGRMGVLLEAMSREFCPDSAATQRVKEVYNQR